MKQKLTYLFSLLLTAFFLLPWSGKALADELTIYESETGTNAYVPIRGLDLDAAQHNQFIIPASELTELQGGTISGLKFYTYSTASKNGTLPTATVSLGITTASTLSGLDTETSLTQVCSSAVSIVSNTWTLTFTTNFSYTSGNLLVDIVTPAGGYQSATFYGKTVTGAAYCYGSQRNFLPRTTFTYTPAPISGPALKVYDGSTKLTSGHSYSFGLAEEGTEKTFTLKNPGTESISLNIAATNGFGVSPASATIVANGEATLTVTMPAATASGAVTITPEEGGVDAFTINVSGTYKDPAKLWCNFSAGLPEGWTNGGYSISTTGGGDGTSGGGYAGYNSSYKRMYTPFVTIADGEKLYFLVSGYYSGYNVSYNTMYVQYSANGKDWIDAKTVSSIANGTWTSVEVTEIPAGNWYIGLYSRYTYFTDFYGGSLPARPKNVNATSVTSSGATIGWNAHGSETAWQVSYSTTSGAPASGILVSASGTPSKDISDLTEKTKYYVSVRIDNGGGNYGVWSDEYSFTTKCNPQSVSDWNEDFEDATAGSGKLPDCWEAKETRTYDNVVYPYVRNSSSYAYNSNKALYFYGGSSTTVNTVVLPSLNANINTLTIEFYYNASVNVGSTVYGNPVLGYMAANGSFVEIETLEQSSSYKKYKKDLSLEALNIPNNASCLAISYAKGSYGYGNMYVDDIKIYPTPNCIEPSGLNVTKVADHGAILAWTKGDSETSWKVQYSASSTFASGNHEVTATTNTAFVLKDIDNIAANSTYYARVKAVCSNNDESSWSNTVSFTTDCEAITTFPWENDFEEETANTNVACWNINGSTTSTASGSNKYYVWGVFSYNDNKMLRMNNYSVQSGSALVTTRNIVIPDDEKEYQLVFDYENSAYKSSTDLTLTVKLSTDSGSTYTNLETYAKNSSASYSAPSGLTEATISLASYAGKTIKLQFYTEANDGYGAIFIDNVKVREKPSCSKPILNDATAQTFEGATFAWTAGGSETQYQVCVVASGAEASDWKTLSENKRDTTLTGFNAGTTYDFYVRSYCGEGAGQQSEAVKKPFTTATVTAPTNVQITKIGSDTAIVSWEAAANITTYQYCVVEAGTEATWNKSVDGLTDTLRNLNPQTSYDFYVRSYYAGNGATAAAEKVNFDTKCVALTGTTWTENFDDYEDGNSSSKAPGCWAISNANIGGYYPVIYILSTEGYVRSGKSLYLNAYNDLGYAYAIFPEFSSSLEGQQIHFWHKEQYTSCELVLGYVTNTDASTFTSIKPCTSSTDWAEVVETIPSLPENGRLAFRYLGGSYSNKYYACIDDISIQNPPSCPKPTAVEVVEGSVTPEGATLSWTKMGDNAYQYAVVESGDPSEWTSIADTFVVISGKTLNTPYTFYVRTDCSELQSENSSTTFTPSITAPTNVQITKIGSDTAIVSWEAAANITTYQYCVVEAGTEATWNKSVDGLTDTLRNLNPQTSYDFYVRSYYAGNGATAAAEKVNFETKCAELTVNANTSYIEHFEDGIPACWDASEYTKQYSFYNYAWEANDDGYSGKCIRFYNYYTTHVLATESINLTVDANLTFYYKNTKGSNFQVMISVDGADRVNLGDALGTATAWTLKEIDLTAYTGHTVQLFFCGNSSTSYDPYLYLDELNIEAWPACRKPASINPASAITGTTATISWTAGGDATNYQYAVALKDEAPVWKVENVVVALDIELAGLYPLTEYDVYVRTYCSASEQSEEQKVSFETGCGVLNAPIEVDFNDNTSGIPTCWDNSKGTTTNNNYKWTAYNRGSGNYCLRFDSYDNAASNTDTLVSPEIKLADDMALKFDCKNKDGGAFAVDMYIAATNDTIHLFTDLTGIADWTEKVYDLSSYSGKTIQFMFCGTSNYCSYFSGVDAYLYMDNFRVVRNITLADNVDNSATLAAHLGETVDVTIGRTLFCDGDFNTICLPFDLPTLAGTPLADGELWAFKYANVENGELLVRIVEAESIEAGKPYLIAFPNGADIENPLFKNVTITRSAGVAVGDEVQFIGILKPEAFTTSGDDVKKKLFVAENGYLAWAGVDHSLKSFRAYFLTNENVGGNSVPAGMPARIVRGTQVATGCETINADGKAVKMLENNQVVIIRNGVKYTVQGQVISK